MKKIFTFIVLIFILSSCTWEEKSYEIPKIIEPEIKKEVLLKNNTDEKTEIIEDVIISATSNWDLPEDWVEDNEWQYVWYSKEALKASKWSKVLYFHADWCGSCKTADTNFSSSIIPSGLNIFKLDYDKSLELRKQYNIITQHTFVEVDENWKMIKKWVWDKKIEQVLENIKKKEWHNIWMAKWQYIWYTEEALKTSKWNKVLFFHATWCPSCKSADTNFLSAKIPSGLNIFKVDFDTATELKKKYSVLAQHTFVQIDKDWKLIKKWAGWRTIEDILDAVK